MVGHEETAMWQSAINDPGGYEFNSPHFRKLRHMFTAAMEGQRAGQELDAEVGLAGRDLSEIAWYVRMSNVTEELADAAMAESTEEIRSSLVAVAAVALAWFEDTFVLPRKEV